MAGSSQRQGPVIRPRSAALVAFVLAVIGVHGVGAGQAAPTAPEDAGAAGGTSTSDFDALRAFVGAPAAGASDTLLAPTNKAFDAFARSYGLHSFDDLLAPRYRLLLQRVAAAHLVPVPASGGRGPAKVEEGARLATADGGSVSINRASGGQLVAQGPANAARLFASAGGGVASGREAAGGAAGAVVHPIDAVLIPKGVYPSLAAALAARPELSVWARLTAADGRAAAAANDTSFSGTAFVPSDAGVAALLKQDGLSFGDFAGGSHMRYLLFFHNGVPEPLTLSDLRRRAAAAAAGAVGAGRGSGAAAEPRPAAVVPSGLSIGGVPAPISVAASEGGGAGAAGGEARGGVAGGGAGGGGTVSVWGALNVRDRAKIVEPDLLVGAGVLHVIDLVMLPDLEVASSETLARRVAGEEGASEMAKLVEAAGLTKALDSPLFKGTLLAPSDEALAAFASKMGYNSIADLAAQNPVLVTALVGYHLIPSALPADDVMRSGAATVTPFKGGELTLSRQAGPSPGAAGAGAGAPLPSTGASAGDAASAAGGGNGGGGSRAGVEADATSLRVAGARNGAGVVRSVSVGRSVLYILDEVLLPPHVFFTIRDALNYYRTTRRLAALFNTYGPASAAAAAAPRTAVTLLAPTDAALAAAAASPAAPALRGPGPLIIDGGPRFLPRGVRPGAAGAVRTMAGGTLAFEFKIDPATKLGEILVVPDGDESSAARVEQMNIVAGRSVIHGVDRVPLAAGAAARAAAAEAVVEAAAAEAAAEAAAAKGAARGAPGVPPAAGAAAPAAEAEAAKGLAKGAAGAAGRAAAAGAAAVKGASAGGAAARTAGAAGAARPAQQRPGAAAATPAGAPAAVAARRAAAAAAAAR